jgi:hypothetical protein
MPLYQPTVPAASSSSSGTSEYTPSRSKGMPVPCILLLLLLLPLPLVLLLLLLPLVLLLLLLPLPLVLLPADPAGPSRSKQRTLQGSRGVSHRPFLGQKNARHWRRHSQERGIRSPQCISVALADILHAGKSSVSHVSPV